MPEAGMGEVDFPDSPDVRGSGTSCGVTCLTTEAVKRYVSEL